ncbi:MAG: hypothetical protein IJP23_04840 [Oscillospiraceae bacterium]|nr:hypothetical protein [Oscillospiraceae bacterium]
MGKKRENLNAIIFAIVAIVIIVVFLVMVFFNSGIAIKFANGAEVEGEKVSATELNFYYNYELNNFLNENGDYISYLGLDPYSSLKDQKCTIVEDMTWHDYFMEQARQSMSDIYTLSAQARANGFKLTEEDYAELQGTRDYFEASAISSGYTMNSYLRNAYGKGVNEKVFMDVITEQYLADAYQSQKISEIGAQITEDEINTYFDEHANDYEMVSYRSFLVVSGTATDEDDASKSEKIKTAEAVAKEMVANIKTEQDFIDQAYENAAEENKATYEKDDATLYTNTMTYLTSVEGEDYQWLSADNRKAGQVTYVPVGDNFRVLMYLGSELDDAPGSADVTMVMVNIENKDVDAARAEMDAIVAEYEADPTYENFKSLVAKGDPQFTEDGVMEGLTVNSFGVNAVDEWVFADDRQAGDTEVIEGVNAVYFVYVNEVEPNWHYSSHTELTRAAFNEWFEALSSDDSVVLLPGSRYVGR